MSEMPGGITELHPAYDIRILSSKKEEINLIAFLNNHISIHLLQVFKFAVIIVIKTC